MNWGKIFFNGIPYQRAFGIKVLLNPLFGVWDISMGSFLNPFSVIICLSGLVFVDRIEQKKFLPFIVAGFVLLLFGSFAGINETIGTILQPNRFIASSFLLFGLGASFVAGNYFTRFLKYGNGKLVSIASFCAFLVLLIPLREVAREVSTGNHGHYGKIPPEITEKPKIVTWLETWIKENTSVDERILFETSAGRIHGGGHIAGYLALKTKREFIGGMYPYTFNNMSFWDKFGFGGPIGELSEDHFMKGLDIYNVGWIIAHTPELKILSQRLPNSKLVAEYGPISIFHLDHKPSYLQSGLARIESRDFNRIVVTDAKGSELVLRYNWRPELVTNPPSKIVPEQVAQEFPPLIKIVNPPDRFEISIQSN